MVKLLIFSFSLICIYSASSCKEKQSTTTTNTDPKTDIPSQTPKDSLPQINCYLFTSGRDSYLLKLDPVYNGKMEFRNFQKDQSFGTVKGTKDGDIIKLWYDFHSEGMRSVSEMHLKQIGDNLMRGLGDVRVSNDTAYNADNSKIDFEKGQLFNKIECDKLKFRY